VILPLAHILTPLEDLFRNILEWLHGTLGLPWAWSIVALTVIVRMVLVPLTVRQIHSMQNLQRHAPQMKELQRKYKGDRQRLNEELMKFYKENNINPAASCLPLVAQFPVFIALYLVLRNFSNDPPEGSLSWLSFVPDISEKASAHWSGYLLIAIYVASQVASTFFMSTTMQKSQRTMLLILPFVFVLFVINFPTGLVLYWMTTNLWTVGQGLVTRRLVPRTPAPAPKRSSRTPSKREAVEADGVERAEEPAEKSAGKAPPPPKRVKRKKKKKARR
jgi:YidC/Oxa1 family membrane protein insertase